MRIEIHDKHPLLAGGGEAMGEHGRDRRFAHAAFAVGNCQKNAHRAFPPQTSGGNTAIRRA